MADHRKCYELNCAKKSMFYCECIPSNTFMCPDHADNHQRIKGYIHNIQYIGFIEINQELKESTIKILCEKIAKINLKTKESIEAASQLISVIKDLLNNIIKILDNDLHEVQAKLEKVLLAQELTKFEEDQLLKSLLSQDVSEVNKLCLIDEKIFENVTVINKFINGIQNIFKKLDTNNLEDITKNNYEGYLSNYIEEILENKYQQNPLTCELEKWENTIMSWNEDLKNYPKTRPSWYFKRGIIEYLAGNMAKALCFFNFAIKLNPNYSDCYFYKGLALINLNRKQESLGCWDQLLQQNSRLSFIKIIKAKVLFCLNRNAESIELYDEFIQNNPERFFVNILKQDPLQALQRYLDMKVCCHEIKRINRTLGIIYSDKGFAFKGLNQHQKALNQFHKATRIDKSCYFACIGIATILNSQGEYKDALVYFSKAIEINPYNVIYFNQKASNLFKLGNLDEAKECFNDAIRVDPDYADSYYNIGEIYRSNGQGQEALKYYDKAIQRNPNNEEFRRRKKEVEKSLTSFWRFN